MRRYRLAAVIGCVYLVPMVILLTGGRNTLGARVAALEAELDRQPVVIDASGMEVGVVIGSAPHVMFAFDALPLFQLYLPEEGSLRGAAEVLFASEDCIGDAYFPVSSSLVGALRFGFYASDGTGRTFVPSGDLPETVSISSRLTTDGVCGPADSLGPRVRAIPVPEMEGLFTPPFEVVTRGDLGG